MLPLFFSQFSTVPEGEKESCCSLRKLLDKLSWDSLSSFPFLSPFFSPIPSVSWLYLTSMLSLSSWTCSLSASFFPLSVEKKGDCGEHDAPDCVDSVGLLSKQHVSAGKGQQSNVWWNTSVAQPRIPIITDQTPLPNDHGLLSETQK